MDAESVRATLQRHFDLTATDEDAAHEVYAEDAVLEFPQSGERFEGVASFREWRRVHPSRVDFEIDRVRGSGDVRVVDLRYRYDGGPWKPGLDVLEFRDGLVVRETPYSMEHWPAPGWRARWRAAPPRSPEV
ncbi:nuclear transport factor 2 family protein [Geodermatophilus sp. SYSU D00079]